MRRKSSGVAVAAVLVGVAVAAVVYIASFGRSHHADAPVPATSALAAQESAASAAGFDTAPKHPDTTQGEQTAAR
ncbi:hypothetical protein AWB76_04092 [Caballeronia temeraria]|uniref:Uncharacterized protein n=1 Tax=Caballeronia temeraria TaxID=1777137 RepID=A0A158BE64_9BURK|nr:hypothetical protein [Caballeronia temeraria]SAK68351.1 hypothetical protein AWB76_04092 [Caballeronia temeraria]